jgi:hypothetical protein
MVTGKNVRGLCLAADGPGYIGLGGFQYVFDKHGSGQALETILDPGCYLAVEFMKKSELGLQNLGRDASLSNQDIADKKVGPLLDVHKKINLLRIEIALFNGEQPELFVRSLLEGQKLSQLFGNKHILFQGQDPQGMVDLVLLEKAISEL